MAISQTAGDDGSERTPDLDFGDPDETGHLTPETNIHVRITIRMPNGSTVGHTLKAHSDWRLPLDMTVREYLNALLQNASRKAHDAIGRHYPMTDFEKD